MLPNNIDTYLNLKKECFDFKADLPPTLIDFDNQELHKAALSFKNASEPVFKTRGTLHNIYEFNNGQENFILRVFNKTQIPAYHFHLEDWIFNVIKDTKIKTPNCLIVDTSRYLVNFDFQILNSIDYSNIENSYEINKNLNYVATSLNKLHQISLNGFGPLDPKSLFYRTPVYPRGIFERWGEYLTKNGEGHAQICLENNLINEEEFIFILRLLRELEQIDDFVPILLHGDLGKHNILNKNDDYYIIDWENAMAGDPIYELASLCAFYMPEYFDFIINTYYKNNKKPSNFERKFWLYYLRIVLSRTVHRINFKKPDNPNYPAPSKRIQLALSNL